jgi:hypothetical protein
MSRTSHTTLLPTVAANILLSTLFLDTLSLEHTAHYPIRQSVIFSVCVLSLM